MGNCLEQEKEEGKSSTDVKQNNLNYSVFDAGEDIADGKNECAICLEVYELNDKIKFVKCSHYFHKECLEKWELRESDQNQCIICREKLTEFMNDITPQS